MVVQILIIEVDVAVAVTVYLVHYEDNKMANKKERNKSQRKYIYAYDPKINRRVVYVINENSIAISLFTGHKFKYNSQSKEKNRKV